MEQETNVCANCLNNKCSNKCKKGNTCGPSGAVYGLGFVGAAVFFIQHADTFWMGALGILKAIVWPAFLVYKSFEFLNLW